MSSHAVRLRQHEQLVHGDELVQTLNTRQRVGHVTLNMSRTMRRTLTGTGAATATRVCSLMRWYVSSNRLAAAASSTS